MVIVCSMKVYENPSCVYMLVTEIWGCLFEKMLFDFRWKNDVQGGSQVLVTNVVE